MRATDVEIWAHRAIDVMLAGGQDEDDRVEMKSELPDAKKAAHHIGGHANIARGEPILWLVGVDAKGKSIPGVTNVEMADWGAKFHSAFDSVSPEILRTLTFSREFDGDERQVMALVFATDRAPYVVKNPGNDPNAPNNISAYVPYRKHNSTHAATREQLLRLLLPTQRLPEVFNIKAQLDVYRNRSISSTTVDWMLDSTCYIAPKDHNRVVIPIHRTSARIVSTFARNPKQEPIKLMPGDTEQGFIRVTSAEMICEGPGAFECNAQWHTRTDDFFEPDQVTIVRLHFHPVGSEHPLEHDIPLVRSYEQLPDFILSRWRLKTD